MQRSSLFTAFLSLVWRLHAKEEQHQYCIVGAGPAGLQLGHFFYHAGRDYAVYEKNAGPGSFFAKFPRHRKLISLNKRFVREGRSAEFALRHDWNSLLDVREGEGKAKPVTQRSKELFPHADVIPAYLADFAAEQKEQIHYETEVSNIQRGPKGSGFSMDVQRKRADASTGASLDEKRTVSCQEVIVATGLWRPRGAAAGVDGTSLIAGYEELPESGEAFEGKSVLILGLGNAAMETAQELQKYTAETHLFARSRELPGGNASNKGVRFAYQTHYVGDIRAGRLNLLDTYLLKSLDTFDFTAFDLNYRLVLIPCLGGRLCVWSVSEEECEDKRRCRAQFHNGGQGLNYRLPMAYWAKGSDTAEQVAQALHKHAADQEGIGWRIEAQSMDPVERLMKPEKVARRKALGIDEAVFGGTYYELEVMAELLRSRPALMDALAPIRAQSTTDNLRYPLDHVIRCFGWVFDRSIFANSLLVNMSTTHNGKYPKITPTFQADGVPGLHFAGTLTHSLDFRHSAGGFIHGFRYTARALFRLFEERNHGNPWPSKRLTLKTKKDVQKLADLLRSRVNEASGPYQMFGSLADTVLFEKEGKRWRARYLEEVPVAHADEKFAALPRLRWVFRYGEGFHGADQVLGEFRVGSTSSVTAEESKFLHPWFSYFPAEARNATRQHWLTEDIFTAWTSDEVSTPFLYFLQTVVADATGLAALGPSSEELAREGEVFGGGEQWLPPPFSGVQEL